MPMMKKITIEVPEEFDIKTAQECFWLGARVFTGVYGGGAFVAYTTDEVKDKGIINILFKNESCAAIIEFSKALTNIENQSPSNKINEINDAGNQVLDKWLERKNN